MAGDEVHARSAEFADDFAARYAATKGNAAERGSFCIHFGLVGLGRENIETCLRNRIPNPAR